MTTYKEVARRWTHLAHDLLDGNGYTDGPEFADNMIRNLHFTVIAPADGGPEIAANHYLFRAPAAMDSLTIYMVSYDDITESDTNYATIEVNSAPGTAPETLTAMMTAVTTKATGGIDIDAGVAQALTLTTTTLASGSWMVVEVTKTGNGVQLGPITFHVTGKLS